MTSAWDQAAAVPDIDRAGAVELVVTDLAASGRFYADVLGLTVTGTTRSTISLQGAGDVSPCLVLRRGPCPAVGVLGFLVRSDLEVRIAERYFVGIGASVQRRSCPRSNVAESVRIQDRFGLSIEFFSTTTTLAGTADPNPGRISGINHFDLAVPQIGVAHEYYAALGLRVSEETAPQNRVSRVRGSRRSHRHDLVLTSGASVQLHRVGLTVPHRADVLDMTDRIAAAGRCSVIESGPSPVGGVSDAMTTLHLRDPDLHGITILAPAERSSVPMSAAPAGVGDMLAARRGRLSPYRSGRSNPSRGLTGTAQWMSASTS